MSTESAGPPFITHAHIAAYANQRVNLQPDDVKDHRDQVNRLRRKLEDHIKENPGFDLVKMLNSGSVAKGTALSTINDMDVAVYVAKAEAPENTGALLAWMKDRLREAYPTLADDQFEMQHHCVTLKFRGSDLDVDVVPVLYEGDPDNVGYLITKDTGDRVRTSVSQHLEFIRKRKNAQPHHFRQKVRLVKWWAGRQKQTRDGFRFKSFMIELICAHLADTGADMSNYPVALEEFFAYIISTGLGEQISFTDNYASGKISVDPNAPIRIIDPVNPENNVAARYSEADRRAIVEAAYDALDAINEAMASDSKTRAVECWQDVFGPSFRGN